MTGDRPEDLRICLDAVSEASRRVRFITFVIVTAAILVSVALWNSSKFSSSSRRVQVGRDAIYLNTANASGAAIDSAKLPPDRRVAAERFLSENAALSADQQSLRDYVEVLNAEYLGKSVFIGVPFFGVYFDANDLGFVAGLTFSLLLFMLQYSLLRKLYKLRVAFSRAAELNMATQFYQRSRIKRALALPTESGTDEESILLKFSPLVLPLLPAVLQGMITYRDLFAGSPLAEAGPGLRLVDFLSIGFFVTIIFLTVGCFRKFLQIEKEWMARERNIRRLGDSSESFEDDWWYSVVSEDGAPQHHGECTIGRDENSYMRISGRRLKTLHVSGKERKILDSQATWTTKWADLTPGPTLRFEYSIIAPRQGVVMNGYCVVDHMVGAPVTKMEGNYFKLAPASEPRNCTIMFFRKSPGENVPPWEA